MANKTNSKVGKSYPIISQVTVAPVRLMSQDISSWKSAVDAARNTLNPRRRLLYELYDNIMLDGKLLTVYSKRKIGVTNKRFVFYKKGNEGETVERIQDEIINTIWFDEMLGYLVDKTFWGHSLIELVPGMEFPIEAVNLIPQTNVVPEKGWLLKNYTDVSNGIPYRGENADEAFKKYLIEYGKPKDYGLLMSIAQYVIYKRGGYGDWAQFAELFGMPFRIGKYDPFDNNARLKLLDALSQMGGAGYTVIPDGSSIEFQEGNSGTGQSAVFSDLIKFCNDEIAQIVLGGTMTTSDGSSHSQSETHKQGEEEITASDLKEITNWLNGPFKKHLVDYFGYSEMKDGYFKVENPEVISITEKIKVDTLVANQVEIDPEYWYKKYGVPMPEGGAKAKINPITNPLQEDPAKNEVKKKSKLSLALNKFYQHCPACSAGKETITLSSSDDIDRLAKLIYDKKLKTGQVDQVLLKQIAERLMDGVTSVGNDAFLALDEAIKKEITENVYVFSGFKCHDYLRAASDLLLDKDGAVRSFSDFKRELLSLDHTYNTVYLQSEYNHAVASSQMAVKWNEFSKNKKNLKYSTAGDSRVTPEDATLEGIILAFDNPFWDKNWPPRHWGCRCDVDETESETLTDLSSITVKPAPAMFQNNVGKDGVIFPKQHPYFETSNAAAKKITSAAKELIP